MVEKQINQVEKRINTEKKPINILKKNHIEPFVDQFYFLFIDEFCDLDKYPFVILVNDNTKKRGERELYDEKYKEQIAKGISEEKASKFAKAELTSRRRDILRKRKNILVKKHNAELVAKNIIKIRDLVTLGKLTDFFTVLNEGGQAIQLSKRIYFHENLSDVKSMQSLSKTLEYQNTIRDLQMKIEAKNSENAPISSVNSKEIIENVFEEMDKAIEKPLQSLFGIIKKSLKNKGMTKEVAIEFQKGFQIYQKEYNKMNKMLLENN